MRQVNILGLRCRLRSQSPPPHWEEFHLTGGQPPSVYGPRVEIGCKYIAKASACVRTWAPGLPPHARTGKQNNSTYCPRRSARGQKRVVQRYIGHMDLRCRYSGSNRKIYTPIDLFYPRVWRGGVGCEGKRSRYKKLGFLPV